MGIECVILINNLRGSKNLTIAIIKKTDIVSKVQSSNFLSLFCIFHPSAKQPSQLHASLYRVTEVPGITFTSTTCE